MGDETNAKFERLLNDIKREEYERGWREAIRAITRAAKDLKDRPPLPLTQEQLESVLHLAPDPTPKRVRKGLVPKTVMSILRQHRRIRYSDLVRAVLEIEPEIAPPSVRSALKNLRLRGVVNLDNEEWLLVGDAVDTGSESDAATFDPNPP